MSLIKSIFHSFLILIILGILVGCGDDSIFNSPIDSQKEENIITQPVINESTVSMSQVLAYLESNYFNTKGYLIEGDNIIVEDDIMFNINELKKDIKNGSNTRQYKHKFIVSQSKVKNITVRIKKNVPTNWKKATRYAFARWNEIRGSKIRFREVSSGGNIVISYKKLSPSGVIARASFPNSAGDPGPTITINTNHNSMATSKKNFTMIHELGHCIGMRHINNSENDRIHIPGTPKKDSKSIMRPVVAKWSKFSIGDIVAAQVVYPPSGPHIVVYQHKNYTGKSYTIVKGQYVKKDVLKRFGVHDNISSIRVRNGGKVVVYEHNYNKGGSLYINSNRRNLKGYSFNDIISSISWNVPSKSYAVLYQHVNYKGRPLTVWFSRSNFKTIKFNDKVSSIRLYNSAKFTAYEHKNYKGKRLRVRSNLPNLKRKKFNDKMSSLRWNQ